MYPLHQSPIPSTSGFVAHRPNSTFKPIHPAAPSTASGSKAQGSPNTRLDMEESTKETGSSPGSSLPCAQAPPALTQGTLLQSNNVQQANQKHENWKRAQDQPQFSNPHSRCLHCAGDHRSQFQYTPCIPQPSPPQHPQQSLSMDGSSTPMLMVNNPEQFK